MHKSAEDRPSFRRSYPFEIPRKWLILPVLCTRIDLNAMLENINLKKRLSREQYKPALPGLQQRLYDLEKACWEYGVPSVIVFEGWDAAGKGTAIAALTQRLDPRGFTVAH